MYLNVNVIRQLTSTVFGVVEVVRFSTLIGQSRPVFRIDRHFPTSASSAMPQASHWPFGHVKLPSQVSVSRRSVYQELSDLLRQVPHTQDVLSFGDAAPMLPALPGLIVEDIGHISLPLREENAVLLQRQAQQRHGNLCLLYPSQVKMTNPEWAKGLEQLCGLCAERLGYNDVGLSPMMTMMLLFGKGGRLEDQQAPDPVGCCVAKLTVQLPSCYSGGDLVVREEAGSDALRYTLGKEDGTAAFTPHYAVYTTESIVLWRR